MAPEYLPPGFRFHPTDEELVVYYLKRKINGHKIELEVIPEIDLYKCEPWDLPDKSFLSGKDLEWYFFTPRDRKYPNGSRRNRATQAGYWKATGRDRRISSESRAVGMKKTLVYHQGRAPHGCRTGWIMHEYLLHEKECDNLAGSQDSYALCRVFKKNLTLLKNEDQCGETSDCEMQWFSMNEQSSTREIFSERRENGPWSNGYPLISEGSTPGYYQGERFNVHDGPKEEHWTEFISNDLSFTPGSPLPESSCSSFNYVESNMSVPMECAKLQHQFSFPPLQMEDFPQLDLTNSRIPCSEFCHLHEIHYVSSTSHDSTHQSDCYEIRGAKGSHLEQFTEQNFHDWMQDFQYNCNNNMGFSSTMDTSSCLEESKSIPITDFDEFQGKRSENLRFLKGLYEGHKKILKEKEGLLKTESLSDNQNVQKSCMEGEIRQNENMMQSIKHRTFQEDSNNLDSAEDLTFDVFEATEINHGLLISRYQVAETLFHPALPSERISYLSNPFITKDFQFYSTGIRRKFLFHGFTAFLLSLLPLLFTSFLHPGEVSEELDSHGVFPVKEMAMKGKRYTNLSTETNKKTHRRRYHNDNKIRRIASPVLGIKWWVLLVASAVSLSLIFMTIPCS